MQASGQWASPLEKSGGPYPYSPSAATALLKAHGWKVIPGGTSTCQRPGTGASDCGAGITAGQPLSFQLAYSSGLTAMDEQNAAIQSSEAQAGVKITPEVRAVQHADRHRWHLHRDLHPGLDLRLAAGRLRLRPLPGSTRRATGSSTPAATTTRAATPARR